MPVTVSNVSHIYHSKTNSIAIKITLILLVTVIILFTAVGGFQYVREKKRTEQAFQEKAARTVERISGQLASFLQNEDDDSIQSLIDRESADPDIEGIFLSDSTGKNWYFSIPGNIPGQNEELSLHLEALKEKRSAMESEAYHIAQKMISPMEEKEYSLQLFYSNYSLMHSMKRMAYELLLQILAFSAISLAAVLISLRKIILKPLTLISSHLRRIADQGDLDRQVEFFSLDELGEMAWNVNYMSLQLKRSFQSIEEKNREIALYNEHLEETVQNRTLELHEANDRLLHQNQEMVKQTQMAQRVQLALIPGKENFPKNSALSFGGKYLAMENLGGDLYDVISFGEKGCCFFIADVSGHGLPAALITAMAKVSFSAHTQWGRMPHEVIAEVNQELYRFIGDTDYYLSAYYGMIDLEKGIFHYSNAGHHPALVYRAGEDQIISLDTQGFFIGSFEEVPYESKSFSLRKRDRIILITDGIVETRNPQGEFFEYDRFHDAILSSSNLSPEEFTTSVIDRVEKFAQGLAANDDRAIFCVDFLGQPKSEEETSQMFKTAIYLMKNRQYEEALPILEELYDENPENVKIINNLGAAYYKLEKLEKALTVIQKGLETDPENLPLAQNLSLVQRKLEYLNSKEA